MQAHAEASPRFEGLLTEAGRLLASSLELDETLRTIARLGIPEFADWCAVDVLDVDGEVRAITSGHDDPAVDALLLELRRRHRAASGDRPAPGRLEVLARREPAIFTAPPGDLPDASPEERERYARVGPVSCLVVPLVADGRTLGTMTFLSTDARRAYDEDDLPVALELAERCAQALRNAQVYEESESARALLATVFAAAPVGMALVDTALRYVLVNEPLAAMNGRPADEHIGRSVSDVLGADGAAAAEVVRGVMRSGVAVTEQEVLVGERAFLASYAPVAVGGRVLGVIAAAVETTGRHRAQQVIARSEARLRALVDAAMFGVARGRGEVLVEGNDAFLEMVGRTRADLERGLPWRDITPERWLALDAQKARELAETGSFDPFEKEFLRPDGTTVPVLVAAAAVPGEPGEWMGFAADLSARRAAERERERLLERTARLLQVTEGLSAAVTADDVAAVIVQEGMSATGACCGVLGLLEGDALRIEHRFGIPGPDPGLLALDTPAPMPTAARERAPVLMESREAWIERFPRVPPRTVFQAFAAVPMLLADGVCGVMGLGFPDRRTFDERDVEMLLGIARQGAQAVERARLFEERAYVARTLQAGLLPRALPSIDGLDLAVRYRPIGDGAEVGGDFYDVVDLEDGAWLVVVGDICGKGTGAAVLTGVMRSTMRALALHESRPEALLAGVNEALLREASPHALAAMACATLRPCDGGFTARIVAGGHPPPLVLRAGGRVDEVGAGGPLLGMEPGLALAGCDERLALHDTLVLYTDGVIDARRTGGPPFGERALHGTLASAAGRDASGVLDVIDAAVRRHAPGAPRDDTALLAARAVGR